MTDPRGRRFTAKEWNDTSAGLYLIGGGAGLLASALVDLTGGAPLLHVALAGAALLAVGASFNARAKRSRAARDADALEHHLPPVPGEPGYTEGRPA